MWISSWIASLHYLALGIGLGSVFARGRFFRILHSGEERKIIFSELILADNLWGLAAILWISTGLMRVFLGLEKGTEFYLHHSLFWLKMGLFLIIFILELKPMITLIRFRIKKDQLQLLNRTTLKTLIWMNDLEVLILIIIPWIASMMARGIGYSR